MNNKLKLFGLLIAVAIMGLSLENALTRHGIKGNKDLNPEVLANGTGTGTGTGTAGTGTGTEGSKYKVKMDELSRSEGAPYREGNKTCYSFSVFYKVSCESGGSSDCVSGNSTTTGIHCFEPT